MRLPDTRLRLACWVVATVAALVAAGCGPEGGTAAVAPPAADAGLEASSDASGACEAGRPDWGRGGALMLPGTDCGGCHVDGGHAEASAFTAAGTLFRSAACPDPIAGATVHVVDSVGTRLDLATNEVGNFYSTAALVPPLEVSIEVAGVVTAMGSKASNGSCGACHGVAGAQGYVAPRG